MLDPVLWIRVIAVRSVSGMSVKCPQANAGGAAGLHRLRLAGSPDALCRGRLIPPWSTPVATAQRSSSAPHSAAPHSGAPQHSTPAGRAIHTATAALQRATEAGWLGRLLTTRQPSRLSRIPDQPRT